MEIVIKKTVVMIVSREESRQLLDIVQETCGDYDTVPLQFLALELKIALLYVEGQILLGQIEP